MLLEQTTPQPQAKEKWKYCFPAIMFRGSPYQKNKKIKQSLEGLYFILWLAYVEKALV